MDNFFTNAFENMNAEQKESFYKTVILQDTAQYAADLRKQYYKGVLKHMGENVHIGAGVKFVNPQYISLGDGVFVGDNATLIARGPGGITLGKGVCINQRVYLDTESDDTGYITVGDGTYIGTGTTLFGHRGLEIGTNVLMAQNITLTPYSHIFRDPDKIIFAQGGHCEKVTIGDDVYVGMRVAIMYSGNIGTGSVIGAGSVVVHPIPEYSVAVGNPARVIRKRDGSGKL